jgi:hypothetical protein
MIKEGHMDFLATFGSLLHGIATLLDFIAGYIGLLLFVLIGVAVIDLICEGCCLGKAYTANSSSLDKSISIDPDEPTPPHPSVVSANSFVRLIHFKTNLLRRSH